MSKLTEIGIPKTSLKIITKSKKALMIYNYLIMETTVFQAHPEIIEDMFYYLDSNTLLNCRLVCKSWNQFLENTTFWLDKLYEIGQPEEVETAWKDLIAKSENKDIEKDIFAKCLRMKLFKEAKP